MICPQCGHDMGSAHRCLRCGYEVKNLAPVDSSRSNDDGNERKNSEEENNTKVIDPSNVYITTSYDDGYSGGYTDPFSSIFDDIFGDPLTSLLGGLFGFDIRGESRSPHRHDEEPQKKKKKQGPVVEVKNVEFFDEEGNKIDSDKKRANKPDSGSHAGGKSGGGAGGKFKNPFKRNGGD